MHLLICSAQAAPVAVPASSTSMEVEVRISFSQSIDDFPSLFFLLSPSRRMRFRTLWLAR